MNGFRITILTLLCLSVALMFYVVLYVIPSWQEEYNTYQSTMRISEYDKKSDMHRQQMQAFDPTVESPEEEQARLAEEEAAKRNERTLQEAEERIIVDAAKRREEAARVRAEAEAAAARAEEEARAAANAQPATVGIVASYDEEWSCIMIKPAVVSAFSQGNTLAVRRGGRIICEAVVDGLDTESGQVSATVKMEQFGSAEGVALATIAPAVGDEVILSPFVSSDELRKDASMGDTAQPVGSLLSLPEAGATQHQLPDAPPSTPEQPAPVAEPAPAAEPAPVAEPAPAAEPAPTADEVQRALDAVPSAAAPAAAEPETPRSNSSLPSLDAVPSAAPAATQSVTPRSDSSLPSLDAMLNAPLF